MRQPLRQGFLLGLAVILSSWACAAGPAVGGGAAVDGEPGADSAGELGAVDGAGAADGPATVVDTMGLDNAGLDDAADAQVVLADATDAADAALVEDADTIAGPDADAGPKCPGPPGCGCSAAADCASSVCTAQKDGKLACAAPCDATGKCPAGQACGDSAGKKACFDLAVTACAPCQAHADCDTPGLQNGACVVAGAVGAFCSLACKVDAECPVDAKCADVKGPGGGAVKACVPNVAVDPTTCACGPVAIAKKAKTACGTQAPCIGTRQCLAKGEPGAPPAGGLSACDAPAPATETCNGADDDCDGAVDDGASCDDGSVCTTEACKSGKCDTVSVVCDDKNVCTKDACDPTKGCTAAPDAAATCGDGNACTNDACVAGVCSSKPAPCDDGSKCTKDSCDPKTGCQATLDPAVCDDGDACTKDACDKAAGCSAVVIAGCGVKLPYLDVFACPDKVWKLDAAVDGGPAWGIDATPSPPGYFSPSCSLNFNDGKAFPCASGAAGVAPAVALGPWIDGTGTKAGAGLEARFKLAGAWEFDEYDNLELEATTDGVQWTLVGDYDSGAPWVQMAANLDALAGMTFRLRFRFWTLDCFDNGTVGAFIDDLRVGAPGCTGDGECDDGNGCTADKCVGGKCTAVDAAGVCDDANPCTTGDVCGAAGTCKPGAPNTDACDDKNACTAPDACNASSCKGGAAKDCDDKQPCTTDSCDTKTGLCVNKEQADGVTCNDADPCTLADVCVGVKCGGKPKCQDFNACTLDACDAAKSGTCKYTPLADGDKCDDDDPCTASDVCAAKACTGKPTACKVVAKDAFACGLGAAWVLSPPGDATAAVWGIDGTPYPPGFHSPGCSLNFNNGKDFTCAAGLPRSDGTATSAQAFDLTGAKEAVLTFWSYSDNFSAATQDHRYVEASADDFVTVGAKLWLENNTQLKTWVPLKLNLTALAGKKVKLRFRFDSLNCSSNTYAGWFVDDVAVVTDGAAGCGKDAECDDGNTCTTNTCKAGQCAIAYAGIATPCDDQNACTWSDSCNGAVCLPGTVTACDDKNPCTVDACDPLKGCVFTGRDDGSFCSDGDVCTNQDVCQGAQCVAKPKCNDLNPCTDDTCSAAGTCAYKPSADGKACTDENPCTGIDACKAGTCAGAAAACSIVATEKFNCADAAAWAVDPPQAVTGWAVDASPSPPAFKSAGCSLNFNNGVNFQCAADGKNVAGQATSAKAFDLGGVKQAVLLFWSQPQTDTNDATDLRWVEASADDFKTTPVKMLLDNDAALANKWTLHKLDLTALAGKAVKVRFRFDSVNCTGNTGAGWFLDDLALVVDGGKGCAAPGDCEDGNPCTDNPCVGGKCSLAANTGAACTDTLPCAAEMQCKGGWCESAKAKVCDDANSCTDDSCNVAAGCKFTSLADASACSDGNSCTISDKCGAGKCMGIVQVDASACSDSDNCTTADKCAGGVCKGGPAAPDATSCNDGDPCTGSDKCAAGKCGGVPDTGACDDKNGCTLDTCSKVTATQKACKSVPVADGLACDDGDICSLDESCKAGLCAGTPKCMTHFTEAFACGPTAWGLDPPVKGIGWNVDDKPNPPGFHDAACSLNFNNDVDYDAGQKVAGKATSPKFLVLAGAQLVFWSYHGVEATDGFDVRKVEVSNNGFGSGTGTTTLSNTTGQNAWSLVKLSLANWAGKSVQVRFAFDTGDGGVNASPGWFLDDIAVQTAPAPCTQDSECKDDGNPCTDAKCAAKVCAHVPNAAPVCDDGEVCTAQSACKDGKCSGTAPTQCDDGSVCTADACAPGKGCTATLIPGCGLTKLPYVQNFSCGDGSLATWAFSPAPSGPKWAVDATPQAPGFLSPSCSLNFNDGATYDCPKGANTVGGAAVTPLFDATALKPGTPLVVQFAQSGEYEDSGTFDELTVESTIDEGKAWKAVATDIAPSKAVWQTVKLDISALAGAKFRLRFRFTTSNCGFNGTSGPFIDDLKVFDATCTKDVDCADGKPCTADKCDLATGKCANPIASGACSDDNPCTLDDACVGGACKGATKPCDDGITCTNDACDTKSGACAFTAKANGSFCSDGNACTTGDSCQAGLCKPKANANEGNSCSDGNSCTTGDNCQGGTCVSKANVADGVSCTDANPCTVSDKCGTGKCNGVPKCDDQNVCTADACEKIDSLSSKCSAPPVADGAVCDDGVACTEQDACKAGKCEPGVNKCPVAKTHKVTTVGFAFSPADLTIQAGDSVEFSPASVHNVVEVSPATWAADGKAPVAGGFLVGFGEVKKVAFPKVGAYFYVCGPHASGGMKGKVTVAP
ncbi:MAG: hypothetical protein EXR79_14295 [Myxococcales bacterium]|nr:hypothetical protein [Myxococcales bacterium]